MARKESRHVSETPARALTVLMHGDRQIITKNLARAIGLSRA